MNPYNSRAAAIVFACFGVFLWSFMAFGPLAETPWWMRFIFLPLFFLWLWATPPRTRK